MTPEQVERNNRVWFDKHSPECPHQAETPINVTGDDFPLGQGAHPYGRYIYVPMPVSGVTIWGFETKAALDRFLADVAAGTLPVAKARHLRTAPLEDDPFAALGGLDSPAAPEPEEDPFAALDTAPSPRQQALASTGPAPDLSDPAHAAPPPEEEEDPFAALDTAPAARPITVNPALGAPFDPATTVKVEDPYKALAETLGVEASADEDEVDEWGEPIKKGAAVEDDPFADL